MDRSEWLPIFEEERPWERITPSGDQTWDQAVYSRAFGWCHAQQLFNGASPHWDEVADEMRRRLDGAAS